MEKKTLIILVTIFIFAYILRILYLPQNALTFGYDQARDAYQSLAIAGGDLKIQGPSASTPGLYHGVFYYYVLAPAYLLSNGNPIVAAYWIAFLNAATVFLIFIIVKKMTKSNLSGFLSALVFAISFESTQYAVWLSNPTIAIWTVPLYYLGLWSWLREGNKWGPILAGIGLGLSVQAEIFLLYHLVPGLIFVTFSGKTITKKSIITSVVSFLVAVSTMILTEIKFGFRGIGGFLSLANASEPIGFAGKSFGDYLLVYLNQIGRVMAYSTYPGNTWIGSLFVFSLLMIALVGWKRKELSWQPFLAVWILSHITVVSVGGVSTPFLLVGIAPAICMLVGISLSKLWKADKRVIAILILLILLYGNLSMILKENPRGQTIFSIQKDMLLSKQLAAIDYTYQEAKGEPFSVNSLTSPLWVNIVWTYLYDWYGENKYNSVPSWHGRDQVGQLSSLKTDTAPRKLNYLILEPLAGIPIRYLYDTQGEENVFSKVLAEKYFGEIVVEKRERIND